MRDAYGYAGTDRCLGRLLRRAYPDYKSKSAYPYMTTSHGIPSWHGLLPVSPGEAPAVPSTAPSPATWTPELQGLFKQFLEMQTRANGVQVFEMISSSAGDATPTPVAASASNESGAGGGSVSWGRRVLGVGMLRSGRRACSRVGGVLRSGRRAQARVLRSGRAVDGRTAHCLFKKTTFCGMPHNSPSHGCCFTRRTHKRDVNAFDGICCCSARRRAGALSAPWRVGRLLFFGPPLSHFPSRCLTPTLPLTLVFPLPLAFAPPSQCPQGSAAQACPG